MTSAEKIRTDQKSLKGILESYLYPFQLKWLRDKSEKSITLKSRQIGASWCHSLRALLKAHKNPKHDYYLCHTTVTNARTRLLEYIKDDWIPLLSRLESWPKVGQYKINKNMIELPNGSRIFAQSNEPAKLRGASDASFLLDEMAFYEQRILDNLEDAVFPTVTNKMNPNGELRIVSTPYTKNLFHRLWTEENDFSKHHIDIYQAKDQGFPISPEEKRKMYTEEVFQREYNCQFAEAIGNYFDHSTIKSLNSSASAKGGRYVGIDIGGDNEDSDFTVLASLIKKEDGSYHLEEAYRMRGIKYKKQRKILSALLKDYDAIEGGCIDETVHPALVEDLREQYPMLDGKRGERSRKNKNTQKLKDLVEKEEISFDLSNTHQFHNGGFQKVNFIANDLSKVERTETRGGRIKFEASRSGEGHADSYSAILLALEASHFGDHRMFFFDV